MHSTLLIICISERTDSLNHVNETFLYFTRTTRIFVLFLRSIQEIDWTKIFPPLFQFIFISQAILHYMFYKSMNIFLSPYTSLMSLYMRSRTMIIHGFLLPPQDWSIVLHRERVPPSVEYFSSSAVSLLRGSFPWISSVMPGIPNRLLKVCEPL